MSQVGIPRPNVMGLGTNKGGVTLPQIAHPLSRMEGPGNLDVRGVSRDSHRPNSQPLTGRPLANENVFTGRKSVSSYGRDSRLGVNQQVVAMPHDAIPEGVEVTHGDPNTTRLPLFGPIALEEPRGSRAGMGSRMDSRMSSRLSNASAQGRLEIDEDVLRPNSFKYLTIQDLEASLKQKIKGSYFEIRKRFRDNDPEQKGNVSREALHRILVTILNVSLSQNVYNRLMERIGLRDKQVINYAEFFAYFRDGPEPNDYPGWMDPVQRQYQDKAVMSSLQVHSNLKEKAKQRFLDIADLIPQLNPGGSGRIMKPEFKQMLNKLMFYMEDSEFEKLWKKYDPANSGTISSETFLKALGITLQENGENGRLSPIAEITSSRTPRKKEIERKQSLDVERWLKNKFREGCVQMKEAFEARDAKNNGLVTFDGFLEVLCKYGLNLEKKLLSAFLSRCSVKPQRDGVPYREFLHRFQDRSEAGMTHNILNSKKHRLVRLVGDRPASPGNVSTMSGIEVQLMNMFQRDFLSLLGTLKSIDNHNTNVISQEEFRAAIESRFSLTLRDDQYESFLDRLPLDEDGNVKYAEFLQFFDTKGMAPSLFGKKQAAGPVPVPAPLPNVMEEMIVPQADRLVVEEEPLDYTSRKRSNEELFNLVKDLLTRKFQDVERAFQDIDEINTKRLTQELMFQLLNRFDIKPEISRGEIREIWKTFITNTDKTLDYLQFVRHFGFSARSAHFPNAKVNPPRKGDADFMIRSRKLNCAADMLQDSLRSKIDYMWEELRKEFVGMDPYGTGYVTREEFKDVLTELCVHLSEFETRSLSDKFELRQDGRVSYIEFLKPFALKKQMWRHGNNMLSLLQHPQPEIPIADIVEPPQRGLHGITSKLRQKLAGDWKNIRRAFKKLDRANDGYLNVNEFRSVLKLANVILDEEEVYHVLTQFDNNMSGKISYERFIDEVLKPPTRQSVKQI
ncbi:EF-hand calcium-binding domain-containing protein 6-like isoform X10 [Mytilus californianus]|uniref:EF-hand calcium-binding domain-containing protein 6-like isoform X10 n=1 Tax=Mytilus californianus TaxID=6549 RepID=UPI0022482641|nr:EF-hand calcium-binding domain-containing protein 6-like isoform X10 [Mytilus californianus]